jgi:hypothetical protein
MKSLPRVLEVGHTGASSPLRWDFEFALSSLEFALSSTELEFALSSTFRRSHSVVTMMTPSMRCALMGCLVAMIAAFSTTCAPSVPPALQLQLLANLHQRSDDMRRSSKRRRLVMEACAALG